MPGKIQVSQDVIDATKSGEFNFERRGMVDVKGIGGIETFFLNGRNVDIEDELSTIGPGSMRSMRSMKSLFASDILEILHSTDQLPLPGQSPSKTSDSVRHLKSIPSDENIGESEVSTDALPEF